MKIRADKIESPPVMGLSAAKARRILSFVPTEWLADVAEVHISGSLVLANTRCRPGDASFNAYDRRLTIFARGHTWQQLVTPILSALAAHHLGFSYRRGHHLSEADAKKLSKIVEPYAEHVLTSHAALIRELQMGSKFVERSVRDTGKQPDFGSHQA